MTDTEAVKSVKEACQSPPCVLFEPGPDNKAWANRVRQHFALGEHSGERTELAMFLRMMEKEFQRAMGGKGRWE